MFKLNIRVFALTLLMVFCSSQASVYSSMLSMKNSLMQNFSKSRDAKIEEQKSKWIKENYDHIATKVQYYASQGYGRTFPQFEILQTEGRTWGKSWKVAIVGVIVNGIPSVKIKNGEAN